MKIYSCVFFLDFCRFSSDIYIGTILSSFLHIVQGKGLASFFFLCLSTCCNTICWKHCSFPHWIFWSPYRKSINHRHTDLFLGSKFYPIHLYVYHYAYSMLSLLPLHCDQLWNHKIWVLLLYSSFPKLFWLFWVTWNSTCILFFF